MVNLRDNSTSIRENDGSAVPFPAMNRFSVEQLDLLLARKPFLATQAAEIGEIKMQWVLVHKLGQGHVVTGVRNARHRTSGGYFGKEGFPVRSEIEAP